MYHNLPVPVVFAFFHHNMQEQLQQIFHILPLNDLKDSDDLLSHGILPLKTQNFLHIPITPYCSYFIAIILNLFLSYIIVIA